MLVGLDSRDDPGNLPLRRNHEARPFDSHVLPAVHAFLFQDVELFGHFFVLV